MEKVRVCAVQNCKTRMSSKEKDSHTVCPKCIGYVCSVDKRCFECQEWPVEQMLSFEKVCKEKAKKRAYRERKVGLMSAEKAPEDSGKKAHELSVSLDSCIEENQGKVSGDVSFSNVVDNKAEMDSFAEFIGGNLPRDDIGDGNVVWSNSDVSAYSPSSVLKSVPVTPVFQPPPKDQGITMDVFEKAMNNVYAQINKLTELVYDSKGNVGHSGKVSGDVPEGSKVLGELKEFTLDGKGLAVGPSSRRPPIDMSLPAQGSCHLQETEREGRKRSREVGDSVPRKRARPPSRSGDESFVSDRQSVRSVSLDQSMCDGLLALLAKHENMSSEEKLRLMKEHVKESGLVNQSVESGVVSERDRVRSEEITQPAGSKRENRGEGESGRSSKKVPGKLSAVLSPDRGAVPVFVAAQVHSIEGALSPKMSTPKVGKQLGLGSFDRDWKKKKVVKECFGSSASVLSRSGSSRGHGAGSPRGSPSGVARRSPSGRVRGSPGSRQQQGTVDRLRGVGSPGGQHSKCPLGGVSPRVSSESPKAKWLKSKVVEEVANENDSVFLLPIKIRASDFGPGKDKKKAFKENGTDNIGLGLTSGNPPQVTVHEEWVKEIVTTSEMVEGKSIQKTTVVEREIRKVFKGNFQKPRNNVLFFKKSRLAKCSLPDSLSPSPVPFRPSPTVRSQGTQVVQSVKDRKSQVGPYVLWRDSRQTQTFQLVIPNPAVSCLEKGIQTEVEDPRDDVSLKSAPAALGILSSVEGKKKKKVKGKELTGLSRDEENDESGEAEEDEDSVQKETESFKESSWVNLNEKIFAKQPVVVEPPLPDNRSPWQMGREDPPKSKKKHRMFNSFVKLTLEELDAKLAKKKDVATTKLLFPPALNYKVANNYRTIDEPEWFPSDQTEAILDGVLDGRRYARFKQAKVFFSVQELDLLRKSVFRILEIFSFLMCAIAVIGDGFDEILEKVEEEDKGLVREFASYLRSLDKAGRHGVEEASVLLTNYMVKQRELFAGMLSFLVPKPVISGLVCAPVSSFKVASAQVLKEVSDKFGTSCHTKALAKVISRPVESAQSGTGRRWFQGRPHANFQRGGRGSYVFRGNTSSQYGPRGAGQVRGNRAKAGRGLARKDQMFFNRRDNWFRGAKRNQQ